MNFNAKLSANTTFPGLTSMLIASAMGLKNKGITDKSITDSLLMEAQDALQLQETGYLFNASAKLIPIMAIDNEQGKSLLDVIIVSLSTIIVNDVIKFTGAGSLLKEPENCANSKFKIKDKKTRRINTAIAIDQSTMTDAQRDELSGAGVVAGEGDNDCSGGSCLI